MVCRDSIRRGFIDHKQVGALPAATPVCVCARACARALSAGLLSLFYPKFVSRGKTSLAGDVPAGLAGERLCHPRAVHASELITDRDSETCGGSAHSK